MTDALSALAAEKFVSLTTFKKDGTPVAAPMWIGRDEDHLFVWTPADSWKAKRAKNNPRVTLVPCGRGGKVRDGAQPVDGTAEVISEPARTRGSSANDDRNANRNATDDRSERRNEGGVTAPQRWSLGQPWTHN